MIDFHRIKVSREYYDSHTPNFACKYNGRCEWKENKMHGF
jgi:hypothetical protein